MPSANYWIKHLRLRPHPEGGYFRETYRSKKKIGNRSLSTAIYFLIAKGKNSWPHRIKSDEMWHFYEGGTLALHMESPRGKKKKLLMGKTGVLQAMVPAGWWMWAEVARGDYALIGCTVSPGFDFADFELRD